MSAELFVALRTEELPARFVAQAAQGLAQGVLALLKGIDHGPVRTWAAPRHIAVSVSEVAAGKPVEEQLVTGPPEAAAFRDGQPTRAAEGFARGRGIAVEDLEIVDGPKGRVVAARVKTGGEQTREVVAAGLAEAILGISFQKTMRWADRPERWARPIHEIVALYDGQLIEAEVAGVPTGQRTLGHRLFAEPFEVDGAGSWLAGLRNRRVEADRDARRRTIAAQLRALSSELGCTVLDEDELLDEVQDLVEWPVTITAAFDRSLLDLPPRLLVESMKVHQRVFPLLKDGALQATFLVVTNQPYATDPEVAQVIAEGNRKVLAARFHDARFFYAEDRKHSLETHAEKLAGMQWIRKGGTMADKQARVARLSRELAPLLGADSTLAGRAGALCKADLATQMVGEFPELQGHVGMLLARLQGEEADVAEAIEAHYLPTGSGDSPPRSPEGRAVALADRIDTLTGCFARGLKPKGSADPLGLRRAANGVVAIVLDAGLRTELAALLALSEEDGGEELVPFVLARARAAWREAHATDVVDAVLATGDTDLVALDARIRALTGLSGTEDFEALRTTFKRVLNITKEHASTVYVASALPEAAERDLHAAFEEQRQEVAARAAELDYPGALAALLRLRPAVDRFFDEVFVMDEDLQVRANRLGLLRSIGQAFDRIADLTKLAS